MQLARILLAISVFFLTQTGLFGQNNGANSLQETYQVHINKSSEKITIDGDLSEEVWKTADVASNFWWSFPSDDRRADDSARTEVRLVYNDQYIYIAATCYDTDDYVLQTLKRDSRTFWRGDAFGVVLDPLNQKTVGFVFGVNPAGVQTESLLTGETGRRGSQGRSGINTAWDNKWFSNVKNYPDRYTIEIAIPFKTLRFKDKSKTWGINFVRSERSNTTYQTWSPVPVQFRSMDLGYTGALIWDKAPKKTNRNISIIPYVSGSYSQDFEEGELPQYTRKIGADAKIAITSSLNLDLTVNPDFSQVEVDQQVTNLTRFNIRFPERRLFFLENSDIFSNFGIPPMRPFFSRRIGLDEDAQPIPINYGARLSGNLNKDFRIGIMNLQTGETDDFAAQNYTAIAFNQRVLKRSTIKGYVLSRQGTKEGETITGDYNRNVGLEFNYLSQDGKFKAFGGGGLGLRAGISDKNHFYNIGTGYDSRNISFYTNLAGAGTNYHVDMGFIPSLIHYDAERDTTLQVGYHHNYTNFSYTLYPEKNPKIISHTFETQLIADVAMDGRFIAASPSLAYRLRWANSSGLQLEYKNDNIALLYPFSFTGETPLPADTYHTNGFEATYSSDNRKVFAYEAAVNYGGFYNGTRTGFSLTAKYRIQPWGNFDLTFARNDLQFPDPYGSTLLWLISPRIEINFSKSVFWTTFFQFNTQNDNFNINSRLQWRFQPMSDLFIVYTDNYAVEMWGPKNRALVLKLNYWLNL